MECLSSTELEKLKTRIADDNPSGENCEYDGLYLDLDSLALGVPQSEMGDSIVEGKDPDYHALYNNCLSLWNKTRDLRVASYLSLASVCLFGLKGLENGLNLIEYLVKEQFDTVYPQLDPDDDNDPTERINIISMLSPEEGGYADPYLFFNHLRDVKLVPELPYSYRDYLVGSGFLDSKNGTVDINSLNVQMSSIPSSSVSAQKKLVENLLSLVDSICESFNEKIGDTGYLTMDSLKHELTLLKNFYKTYENGSESVESTTSTETDVDAQNNGTSVQSNTATTINTAPMAKQTVFNLDSYEPKTRNDALILLKKSADYFTKAEPTSPVPFLIQRALRMANMNFMDLLAEIDSNALDRGREQFGVKPEDNQFN